MEKKIAFMPPSRMRGMSTCPSGLRLPRSKSLERGVASCRRAYPKRLRRNEACGRARKRRPPANFELAGLKQIDRRPLRTGEERASSPPQKNWQEEFTPRASRAEPVSTRRD